MKWIKQKGYLTNRVFINGGQIKIEPFQNEDAGIYICEAEYSSQILNRVSYELKETKKNNYELKIYDSETTPVLSYKIKKNNKANDNTFNLKCITNGNFL